MKQFLTSTKFRWGIILFLIVFCIFSYTAAQYHVGISDSDELITTGYTLGLAHGPGYPLYTLILFIATHIIPFGSIAFKASLTSVLFSSLTIFFFYLSSLEILANVRLRGRDEKIKKKKYRTVFYLTSIVESQTIQIGISIASSFILAFSFLFWLFADIADVYALESLFVIVLVYLTLVLTNICLKARFNDAGKIQDDNYKIKKTIFTLLIWIVAIAGLAVGHEATILFIYPVLFGYIVYILFRSKYISILKNIFHLLFLFIIFLATWFLPYMLLLWYNARHVMGVSWSFSDLWGYIFHLNYTTTLTPGDSAIQSIHIDFSHAFAIGGNYISLLVSYFTITPLIHSVRDNVCHIIRIFGIMKQLEICL